MKKLLYILILPLTLFLVSCGGGGSDDLQPTNYTNPDLLIGYGWGHNNHFLYKTIDGGATWDFVNVISGASFCGDSDKESIAFLNENLGIVLNFCSGWGNSYAVTTGVTTASGGLGFAEIGYSSINNTGDNLGSFNDNSHMVFENIGNLFYLKIHDAILRKYVLTNNGTFLSVGNYTSPNILNLELLSFVNDSIGYGTGNGENGDIYKTYDGGYSWDSITSLSLHVNNLSFISESIGYAFSDYNNWIYKTTDGGINWDQITQISLNKMEFINENIGYGFFNNMIYRSIDGGISWSMINDNNLGISTFTFVN